MANKAVFWDRDGTLLKHFDYLVNVDDVALIRGAAGAVKYLSDRGYKSVVVTNQSAVARGMITEKELAEINRRFTSLLFREGATIDKLYYCPFHPEAVVEQYRKDSDLRKPSPGMLLLAAKELDLDLSQSWMIGDDDRDVLAGQAAGCKTILIKHQATELVQRGKSNPDFVACSPQEAANIVAHYSNKPEVQKVQEAPVDQPAQKQVTAESAISEPVWAAKEPVSDVPAVAIETPVVPEKKTPEKVEKKKKNNKKDTVAGMMAIEPEQVMQQPEPVQPVEQVQVVAEQLPVEEPVITKARHEDATEQRPSASETDVLHEILRELRRNNVRQEGIKPDFSGATLMAGITQILVLFCLIMAYVATGGEGMSYDKVQAWLLTGLIFQMMTVSLMMMNR